MPHVIVEYSGNLDGSLDVGRLLGDLHQTVIDSKVADIPAIRTRAKRREAYRVGDGSPENAFVHVTMRLRIGRSEEIRTKLADALLAATDRNLQRAYAAHPIAITVEIEEIDNITARKNTVRKKGQAA